MDSAINKHCKVQNTVGITPLDFIGRLVTGGLQGSLRNGHCIIGSFGIMGREEMEVVHDNICLKN